MEVEEENPEPLPGPSSSEFQACSFAGIFSEKLFITQRGTACEVTRALLYGNTIEELITKIWEVAKNFIKREILVNNGTASFSDAETPSEGDINKFVLVQDKARKRTVTPSQFTDNMLKNFRKNEIQIFVLTYSTNIANRKLWEMVDKTLLKPIEKDRAAAHSNQAVVKLVLTLKEKHQDLYHANDVAWTLWANEIQASEPHLQEALIEGRPSKELRPLFMVGAQDHVLENVKHNVIIANNIQGSYTEQLAILSNRLDAVKSCVSNIVKIIDILESDLNSFKSAVQNNSDLLNSVSLAANPVESQLSLRLAEQVGDMEDLDHQ